MAGALITPTKFGMFDWQRALFKPQPSDASIVEGWSVATIFCLTPYSPETFKIILYTNIIRLF